MGRKISVVIPFYPIDEGKHEVLQECVQSLPEHYETIVVWNRREGYAPAINNGVKCASGDYYLIMNDDVVWKSGKLDKLCIPGVVTSPTYNSKPHETIWGSCFCVPSNVWSRIGGMDERYTISYFDDDDLIKTLESHDVSMRTVEAVDFDHPHPGRTLDSMPDRDEFFQENKKKFEEKWK